MLSNVAFQFRMERRGGGLRVHDMAIRSLALLLLFILVGCDAGLGEGSASPSRTEDVQASPEETPIAGSIRPESVSDRCSAKNAPR